MIRLKPNLEDMAQFCPRLAYHPDGEGGFWTGELTPLKNVEYLFSLLDDLYRNRPIFLALHGEIRHDPNCAFEHERHDWMGRIKPVELLRTFHVRIFYSGGPEDPRCWVEGITQSNCRHMWRDGSICPFLSSKSTWDWRLNTVFDFVGHSGIFIIAWMVFHQTGNWIVGEHDSTASYHLRNIRPYDHCWCRSGKRYLKCHLPFDQTEFVRIGR